MEKRTDLVYILGTQSKWHNNEIRFSLRSVAKNLECAGRIFIVGEFPKWINKERVTNIPAEDIYRNKLKNAVHKILLACRDPKVSDNFILMNDDFFFLKRTREVEYFNKGFLKATKRNHETKGGYYYDAIKKTISLLKDFGIDHPYDFENHYPIILNKEKFIKTFSTIDYKADGLIFRSVYHNLNRTKSEYRPDLKVYEFDEFPKNADFISTDNKVTMDSRFQRWIRRRFEKPSIYERDPEVDYYATRTINYGGRIYNTGDLIRGPLPEKVILENKLRSRVIKK
jgi:hypothetical protein